MKVLFKYEELVILQDEFGEVFVVSLVHSIGKVYHLDENLISNGYIMGAITEVLWNNLGSNADIIEYIDAYKESDLYKYTKTYEEMGAN